MTQYFTITITITCRIASHLPIHRLATTTVLRFCSLRTSHHSRLIADTLRVCPPVLSFAWLACIFLPRYSPSPNQSLFAHKRLSRLQPPPKTTGHCQCLQHGFAEAHAKSNTASDRAHGLDT